MNGNPRQMLAISLTNFATHVLSVGKTSEIGTFKREIGKNFKLACRLRKWIRQQNDLMGQEK